MSDSLHKLDAAARKAPVVPVIVVGDARQAAPLAKALVRAGITIAEVTLRTPAGLAAIAAMKAEAPELLVGAGTVLTGQDADAALAAGAEFLVSPGMSPGLRAALKGRETLMIPGIATASEAMARHEEGFARLKLFPASIAGGAPALKALAGPLPHLKFMPTGGISEDEVKTYLQLPNVFALGGSWIASQADIAASNWARIEDIARRLLALA
ncbi:MAG: bifunctional 4-hydroxy-2-oxoglutarate aldolase/2-dehydro-3-deoxy-phosphogluconate aldolase [Hyphomonas sp.]|uniref:bifunctional 4-hydroxy-2-oxoglutarate aldolase/2-dehydro-3-deoxy-phosphogluconate aldolase n=1 Tax=Hyphomonas sp. TaxID=87 RepID=UPI00180C9C0E|nr:bifunctional 4-hydroxy-2-oxoglutarate aldolase/2-dehydro-3-deoxy-phosphogluconate aldolase [Hyphomonas sp.]MBA3067521.1 bifunctional 4-hydroxy-2-oxoglutarate aldolase/2-dehydro-3-deoxy-phosphogluconate aldolase [Hyphomonas sp.]MBU3920064.1 bifunctional 4-hydroxy-2-oxoglutarate aldolase/2-dehydro-3-deoxy-phosphogluconate aldolase [Alphaproteobacteria bacterium]MBU4063409.1 bifunctional 4-hydroxy-2-oxoglutarate aldolase/2-dehydro-3-deoxy-phosphogluconate aldolase [Alphaproteobacteria bacterium]